MQIGLALKLPLHNRAIVFLPRGCREGGDRGMDKGWLVLCGKEIKKQKSRRVYVDCQGSEKGNNGGRGNCCIDCC